MIYITLKTHLELAQVCRSVIMQLKLLQLEGNMIMEFDADTTTTTAGSILIFPFYVFWLLP